MPEGQATSAHSNVHLGQQLRARREQAGLNQAEAARKSGVSRNTLVALEGRRAPNPNLETLLRLMRTYRLGSLEELLGQTPSDRLLQSWDRPARANAPRNPPE